MSGKTCGTCVHAKKVICCKYDNKEITHKLDEECDVVFGFHEVEA